MSDFVFNAAKGRAVQWGADAIAGTNGSLIRMLALKASAADATAVDYDTVAALLADASTTEADFTNYARKDVTGTLTRTLDDTDDEHELDCADQTWTSAGGATNNTLTDVVFYYDPDGSDTDAQNVPISQHDFTPTTTGADVTVEIPADGFYAAG